MRKTRLAVSVDCGAAQDCAFQVLTDWPRHSEWMFLTGARVIEGDGASAGSRMAAFTGLGPLGVTDTMEITRWDPPGRVVVRHTGRVVRGEGTFRVVPDGDPREKGCRILWAETLNLPFGALGRLGWSLIAPVARALLRLSLRRLARLAEAGPAGVPAGASHPSPAERASGR